MPSCVSGTFEDGSSRWPDGEVWVFVVTQTGADKQRHVIEGHQGLLCVDPGWVISMGKKTINTEFKLIFTERLVLR
jgi:hypothetical protein